MRTLKTLALAVTAALSVTSVASAQGYGGNGYHPAPTVQTYYAPGTGYTGYTPTNVNYHGHGNQGHGYGNQGGHGGHAITYYRVHGVSHHDHLNVRHGPGVRNHVVYRLPYNARGIQVGNCAQISTSHGPATWCTVAYQGYQRGWVNARYLAQDWH
ncbi:SH3 domain-containing protein [Gymnodinialimonas sp.]